MKFDRLIVAVVVSLASLGIASQQARASIVWDQSIRTEGNVTHQDYRFNPIHPESQTYSTWMVGDVHFDVAVTITDIHTYVTGPAPAGSTLPVDITLFTKTGPMPGAGEVPGNLGTGVASYTGLPGYIDLHLSGQSITLAPGDYWIGITPVADFTEFGPIYHWEAATTYGDQSAMINPSGAWGRGTNWINNFSGAYFGDMTLKLEGFEQEVGAAPEPFSLMVWVGLIAAVVIRRVRATAI